MALVFGGCAVPPVSLGPAVACPCRDGLRAVPTKKERQKKRRFVTNGVRGFSDGQHVPSFSKMAKEGKKMKKEGLREEGAQEPEGKKEKKRKEQAAHAEQAEEPQEGAKRSKPKDFEGFAAGKEKKGAEVPTAARPASARHPRPTRLLFGSVRRSACRPATSVLFSESVLPLRWCLDHLDSARCCVLPVKSTKKNFC